MRAADRQSSSERNPGNVIAKSGTPERPAVTSEERRHLAECCAFFKAAHYREATPGTIRASDVSSAEAIINEIVTKYADASDRASNG
jgi:hypothetical protein